ncbi:MAG: mycofactocin precursor MftA [Mycobacterium sp.]
MESNQQIDKDAGATVPATSEAGAAVPATSDTEIVTETLVEEVSIDGMCGVY